MTDTAIPIPTTPRLRPRQIVTAVGLVAAAILLFSILASINWSAVLSKAKQCENQRGAFSSGFSAAFDTDRERCPRQSNALPLLGSP